MSAEQWEAADLSRLVPLAGGALSDRKLQLFNCWCLHALRPYLTDPRIRAAVWFAETHIDQPAEAAERDAILRAARAVVDDLHHRVKAAPDRAEQRNRRVYAQAALIAQQAISSDLPHRGVLSISQFTAYAFGWANDDPPAKPTDHYRGSEVLRAQHLRLQAAVFRDIFANPFRPVAFDTSWRTPDAVGLARAIYAEKAFERLPILADALMDADCTDEQVIGHCRGPGPHVRGCWVVDWVLGKECARGEQMVK